MIANCGCPDSDFSQNGPGIRDFRSFRSFRSLGANTFAGVVLRVTGMSEMFAGIAGALPSERNSSGPGIRWHTQRIKVASIGWSGPARPYRPHPDRGSGGPNQAWSNRIKQLEALVRCDVLGLIRVNPGKSG